MRMSAHFDYATGESITANKIGDMLVYNVSPIFFFVPFSSVPPLTYF